MPYYLNYKLKLKSGIVYESDNGGYQGAPRDAFRLANIEEDFKDADMSDPAIGLLLSIRKRWFIEYFNDNLLFGFRKNNIEYLDWSID